MDYKERIAKVFDRSVHVYGKFGSQYYDVFAERLISYAKDRELLVSKLTSSIILSLYSGKMKRKAILLEIDF